MNYVLKICGAAVIAATLGGQALSASDEKVAAMGATQSCGDECGPPPID